MRALYVAFIVTLSVACVGVMGIVFVSSDDERADHAIQTIRAVARDRDQWRQIALQFEQLNMDCLQNRAKEKRWTPTTTTTTTTRGNAVSSQEPSGRSRIVTMKPQTVRMPQQSSTPTKKLASSPNSSSSSSLTISYEEGSWPNLTTHANATAMAAAPKASRESAGFSSAEGAAMTSTAATKTREIRSESTSVRSAAPTKTVWTTEEGALDERLSHQTFNLRIAGSNPARPTILGSSSAVEQGALNAQVASSNLAFPSSSARHRPSAPPDAPPDCSFANPTNDAILKFYNDIANGWYTASLRNPPGYRLPSLFQCRGDLVKRMQDDRAADPLVWLYEHDIYMRDVYVWHSFTVTRDPALKGYVANVSYLSDVVVGETAREMPNGDVVDDPDCDVCEVWFWYPMVQGTPVVVGWRKP